MTTVRLRPELSVHTQVTVPRATAAPAADRFREALGRSASQLVAGVEQAAGFIPGGPVITAAIRGATGGEVGHDAQSLSASPETTGAGGRSAPTAVGGLADQSNQAMQLLELQHALAMEQQRVQTLSNVMKARHDSNKAVIGNLR